MLFLSSFCLRQGIQCLWFLPLLQRHFKLHVGFVLILAVSLVGGHHWPSVCMWWRQECWTACTRGPCWGDSGSVSRRSPGPCWSPPSAQVRLLHKPALAASAERPLLLPWGLLVVVLPLERQRQQARESAGETWGLGHVWVQILAFLHWHFTSHEDVPFMLFEAQRCENTSLDEQQKIHSFWTVFSARTTKFDISNIPDNVLLVVSYNWQAILMNLICMLSIFKYL